MQSSGNEVFYRNPFNVNENLFVNISSPSSSKYSSVDDLKSPGKAAERTRQQYLRELLSTRIGVKRTADVVSASDREASDGRKYYDLEVCELLTVYRPKLLSGLHCLSFSLSALKAMVDIPQCHLIPDFSLHAIWLYSSYRAEFEKLHMFVWRYWHRSEKVPILLATHQGCIQTIRYLTCHF